MSAMPEYIPIPMPGGFDQLHHQGQIGGLSDTFAPFQGDEAPAHRS